MRDRIFYSICFGFLCGVLLRSFVVVNIYFILLFALLGSSVTLYFTLVKFKWGIIASIFILAFCLGIFRFHMADTSAPEVFESQVGQKVSYAGEIIDEPDVRQTNQELTVEVENGKEKTKILVSAGLDESFKYGDEINFSGTLKKPENFMTGEGKVFDYVNYLRKDGIIYLISYPKIEIDSSGNGNIIKSGLFSVKEKFLAKINYLIPSPESIFAGGLMLGERSEFDQALKQSFINTGMIHLITLSGYKVTMVAGWFTKLFSFLPLSIGIGIGIFSIWLFVLMTGAASTGVRAGIMATLAIIARATGRNYDIARALILTGVIMILLNPFVLVYDVSFQLSFIGTVAIIFFTPKIEKYFMWVTDRFGLRDIVTITVAIYIFVTPFILYEIGDFSLVALPANVLIMPLFPITIIFGFLTGLIGFISNILAVPLAYISYLLLHYQLWVINFLSSVPLASLTFSNFPLILTILIYFYFTYILFGKSIKNFFTEHLESSSL